MKKWGEHNSLASALTSMKDNPYETVFIVGNGVVENGWKVCIEALKSSLGYDECEPAPIHPIAALTFELRMMAGLKESKEFRERYDLLRDVRTKIAEVFRQSQSSGVLSLKFTTNEDYFSQYARGRTFVICTNWDTLVRTYCESKYDFLSIHGDINEPKGIYLPTESAIEPYRDASDAMTTHLVNGHRIAIEALEKVKRIVIWGSSLEVYDAELCVLVRASHSKDGREYIVIDPCDQPVKRLRAIVGKAQILHINPLANQDKNQEG